MSSILKKTKEKLVLSMFKPFGCTRDEIKCIMLGTWNKSLDIIDGFFGFKCS
jgi:DNA polymerase III epsilon subunit-like protein